VRNGESKMPTVECNRTVNRLLFSPGTAQP
jgi:hypothetical protein